MCACVRVSIAHTWEPCIIQAHAYCPESTGFTGREMYTQVKRASENRMANSRSPLGTAMAGATVTMESCQDQEESGLNTRKSLLRTMLVL